MTGVGLIDLEPLEAGLDGLGQVLELDEDRLAALASRHLGMLEAKLESANLHAEPAIADERGRGCRARQADRLESVES